MDQPDVLRIDLALDKELLEALVICAERWPEMDFASLMRELLVAEASRIAEA